MFMVEVMFSCYFQWQRLPTAIERRGVIGQVRAPHGTCAPDLSGGLHLFAQALNQTLYRAIHLGAESYTDSRHK
jgi:hypothetical protein